MEVKVGGMSLGVVLAIIVIVLCVILPIIGHLPVLHAILIGLVAAARLC